MKPSHAEKYMYFDRAIVLLMTKTPLIVVIAYCVQNLMNDSTG